MEKIYKIEEVKKWRKYSGIAAFGTYSIWMGTIIADAGLYTIPALAAYTAAMISSGYIDSLIQKSQEYRRFKEIYKEIMDEYSKLNVSYNLKTPTEIYALFDIVYKSGFLSIASDGKCRMTKYDNDLMKELTLNNHGVCRHVATMLTDVYTRLGYTASPIVVATPEMKEEVKEVEIPAEVKEQMEKLQQMFQIEINGHKVTPDEIKIGEAKMFETRLIPQPITDKQVKYGNHAITRVNSNGYSFNFDPMKRAIYIPGEGDYFISDDKEQIRFSPKGTKRFNDKLGIKTQEQLDTLPMEEQFESVCVTQERIIEHQDDLKDFRNTILPKLEESEEMYKLILK